MKFAPKKGFTIIELMLAMIFLSTLLVVIAVLILNMITIFQKGMSIKSINSASRSLIDDFNRSVSGSLNVKIGEENLSDGTPGYISRNEAIAGLPLYFFQDTTRNITIPANQGAVSIVDDWPIRGAFCTGGFTYIWNTGYALNRDYASPKFPYKYVMRANDNSILTHNQQTYANPDLSRVAKIEFLPASSWNDDGIFQLLKVQDPTREICSERARYGKDDTERTLVLSTSGQEVLEMLESSKPASGSTQYARSSIDEYGLALYDFRMFPAVRNTATKHIFYSGTFILGTLRGGVNIMANGEFCRDDSNNLTSDFAYCSVNKFNFSMRATGETPKGEGS